MVTGLENMKTRHTETENRHERMRGTKGGRLRVEQYVRVRPSSTCVFILVFPETVMTL